MKPQEKNYVILKFEQGEKHYVRTTESGISTFCESIKHADRFTKKEAIEISDYLQKKKTQMYYMFNIKLKNFFCPI
jgi:hypothetical protein